jgi:hypothetical protein
MSRLLVRGALDEMHRSLLGEGPGRPVLSVSSGERAIVARRLTKGVLLFRRARLDLHRLDALRGARQLRWGDVESIVSMHVEEDVETTRDLEAAVDATLTALNEPPPATKSAKDTITVTTFGTFPGDSFARSFHELPPALAAAMAPLLAQMSAPF